MTEEKLSLKDLAIAFANNQKVTYYDDERELNQTCRIFALTEDTISIVNEEYQYDDLSFDKIINIISKTTQQIIDEDFSGGLDIGQILPKQEATYSKKEVLELLNAYNYGISRIELLEWFEQFKINRK